MLTIGEIRNKVNAFPDDKPVEELLDELVLLYKIEKVCRKPKKEKDFPWTSSMKNLMHGGSRSNAFCITGYQKHH